MTFSLREMKKKEEEEKEKKDSFLLQGYKLNQLFSIPGL